jgi:hypothetical protein
VKNLTEKDFNTYTKTRSDYNWISQYKPLSEEDIQQNADKVNWTKISIYQTLSEDFIAKYYNKKEKDSNIGWGPSCSLTGNYMVNGEVENAFL